MKTIEDQALEYAEALNDIADLLDMPTGSTSAQIVKMAENRWASGIHTCHNQCSRTMCVLRRERDALKVAGVEVIEAARRSLPRPHPTIERNARLFIHKDNQSNPSGKDRT